MMTMDTVRDCLPPLSADVVLHSRSRHVDNRSGGDGNRYDKVVRDCPLVRCPPAVTCRKSTSYSNQSRREGGNGTFQAGADKNRHGVADDNADRFQVADDCLRNLPPPLLRSIQYFSISVHSVL